MTMAGNKKNITGRIAEIAIAVVIIILVQKFIPVWWLFSVITFIMGWLVRYKNAWRSFVAAWFSVFVSWMALYFFADIPNNSILSSKMAVLFSLPNQYILFAVASLVMGLIGGCTAAAAYSLRKK